jgi:hypothetical protein
MWGFRFSDMWRLYPAHCSVPIVSKHNQTLCAAPNLFEQLGLSVPTTADAKMKHLAMIRQLTEIMGAQTPTPPPGTAPPRAGIATPPRVLVAAPPRVATQR